MWIAKDIDDVVVLFEKKPVFDEEFGVWVSDGWETDITKFHEVYRSLEIPDDQPMEVQLKIHVGSDWYPGQSPWISAKEIPPMDKPLLLKYGDGGIDDMDFGYYTGLHYFTKNGQIVDEHVIEWMEVSF